MRTVIGLMTGTSIDGLDAAAVRIEGSGLDLRACFLAHEHAPLGDLSLTLRALASGERMAAADIAAAALALGELHAALAASLAHRVGKPALVAAHGQTVFHSPPRSWQLLNPAPIGARLGCPVVYDLRAADIARGGQGAPITPIADFILLRDEAEPRAVVNLGGFCNITTLPDRQGRTLDAWLGAVRGRDVCACNHILDAVARRALLAPYDESGAAAARGTPNTLAAEDLAGILLEQSRAARSLGTGDESLDWLDRHADALAPDDLAATAAKAVGQVIGAAARAADPSPARVLVAGGGAHHLALVEHIARAAGAPTEPTDDLGLPIAAREAAEIAVLGALCADGVPITLPAVTGAPSPAPLSGAWSNCTPRLSTP